MWRSVLLWLALAGCAPSLDKTPWVFAPAPPSARAAPMPAAPASRAPQHGAGGPESEDEPVVLVEYLGGDWQPPERVTEITLQWPLPATGVTSLFGDRDDPFNGTRRFHYGVDLEASYGAVVRAAAAGRVVQAGFNAGHGRQVVLSHAGGFQTGYSHLAQVLAYEGTWVEAGAPIGFVGTSGRSTGPHLHLEVTRWGIHVDPLEVLGVRVNLADQRP